MTVETDCGMDNVMWIRGGRWIVYHFDGEIKDIFETLQECSTFGCLTAVIAWRKRYGLNIYRRIDRDDHSVVMDLCIPVL